MDADVMEELRGRLRRACESAVRLAAQLCVGEEAVVLLDDEPGRPGQWALRVTASRQWVARYVVFRAPQWDPLDDLCVDDVLPPRALRSWRRWLRRSGVDPDEAEWGDLWDWLDGRASRGRELAQAALNSCIDEAVADAIAAYSAEIDDAVERALRWVESAESQEQEEQEEQEEGVAHACP